MFSVSNSTGDSGVNVRNDLITIQNAYLQLASSIIKMSLTWNNLVPNSSRQCQVDVAEVTMAGSPSSPSSSSPTSSPSSNTNSDSSSKVASSSDSQSLSAGSVVGIVFGIIFGLIVIIMAILYLMRIKNIQRKKETANIVLRNLS